MGTGASVTTKPGIALSAPQIEILGGEGLPPVVHTDRNLQSILSKNTVGVWLRDVDDSIFTNSSLDARLELWTWKRKHTRGGSALTNNVGPVPRGYRHPSNWVGGVDLTACRTRGGGHYDVSGVAIPTDRQTEFPLLGLAEYTRVNVITPIAQWYEMGDINYYPNGTSSPAVTSSQLIVRGSNVGAYSSFGNSAANSRFGYANAWMRTYYRFAVSIQDPNGDGTSCDRILGPFSEEISARPEVWPFGIDINGQVTANTAGTNRLIVLHGRAAGRSGR